jgi:thioredoxin 1
MPRGRKVAIIAAVALVVVAALAARSQRKLAPARTEQVAPAAQALPRLLELGSDQCVPCKLMAPILDELRKTHAGKLRVDFIDVWKDPEAGKQLDIEIIPTQVFFDATGKELFRHQGFFAKPDILAKWKELGVDLDAR